MRTALEQTYDTTSPGFPPAAVTRRYWKWMGSDLFYVRAREDGSRDLVHIGTRVMGPPGLVGCRISGRTPWSLPAWRGSVGIYRRDVVVRRGLSPAQGRHGGGIRGRIEGMSDASRRRLMFVARNVDQRLPTFLHLTYGRRAPTSGREVKRHWERMRHWLTRRGIGGLWFLEFQERGAPHIHALLTGRVEWDQAHAAWFCAVHGVRRGHRSLVERYCALRRRLTMMRRQKASRHRIRQAEHRLRALAARLADLGYDTAHLDAGVRVEAVRAPEGAAAYVSKYAAKQRQKRPPATFEDVGRMWGLWGGVTVTGDVITGELADVAAAIRAVRRVEAARWRRWGRRRRRRDRGYRGWISWDCAEGAFVYIIRCCVAGRALSVACRSSPDKLPAS